MLRTKNQQTPPAVAGTRREEKMTLKVAILGAVVLAGQLAATAVPAAAQDGSLPERVRASKTVIIGASFGNTKAYYDNGKEAGLDVDMCNAVFGKLGLKTKWVDLDFKG